MRRFWRIFYFRCKAVATQPAILICLILASALSVGMATARITGQATATSYPIAVVNEDSGALSQELLDSLSKVEIITVGMTERIDALRQLATGAVDGVFIISPHFTQTLKSGEYEKTVSLYVSTASSAARPVSEAVTGEVPDGSTVQVDEGDGKLALSAN